MGYIHHRCDHNQFIQVEMSCILYTNYCTEHKRNEEAGDTVLTSGSSTEFQYLVVGTNSPTCHGTVEERLPLHNQCSPRTVSTDIWVGKVGENQGELVASIQSPTARNKAAIKINVELC